MNQEEYTIKHFSQGMPKADKDQENVAVLLRRVADTIEAMEKAKRNKMTIFDMTFHNEVSDDGRNWPSITVYYEYETEDEKAIRLTKW